MGEAAVPGPADLFSEIDAAIEYEEQLPALDESSDDEPMPPPDADEDRAQRDDDQGQMQAARPTSPLSQHDN